MNCYVAGVPRWDGLHPQKLAKINSKEYILDKRDTSAGSTRQIIQECLCHLHPTVS